MAPGLPDTDGDETDRLDEAFTTYDIAPARDQWDPDTVIVDDELRTLFAQVPSEVLLEVYLDTCHSGSGLRAFDVLPGRPPKFIPPPTPDGLDAVLERSARVLDRGRFAATSQSGVVRSVPVGSDRFGRHVRSTTQRSVHLRPPPSAKGFTEVEPGARC